MSLKIEDWQRAVASDTKPEWYGDLKDDCTARWAGLTLRAEWMDGEDWWWAVTDDATNTQIEASNDHEHAQFSSGEAARAAAERAAREWLRVSE